MSAGPGHFSNPLGVAITRNEGEYHVAFVADAGNGRIVALALGYNCQCVKWLGTVDGHESGTPFSTPTSVAWDPAQTWTLTDDRIFVVDSDNNRVVVYQVSLDLVNFAMTAHYVGSFGSKGNGANQFIYPRGIAVEDLYLGGLYTNVYITDTGNKRVSLWFYDAANSSVPDTGAYSAYRSAAMPNATLDGVSVDAFGDIIVSDVAHNQLLRLKGSTSTALTPLMTYGGASSWANGNFVAPTGVYVIYGYSQSVNGGLVTQALPYLSTTEQWGDTTGIQLHRLGVDPLNFVASVPTTEGARAATLTWMWTAQGSYQVTISRLAGGAVRTFSTVVAGSGPKSLVWDGNMDNGTFAGYGNYVATMSTESGYTYDQGQPRVFTMNLVFRQPLTSVTMGGPTTVQPNEVDSWSATPILGNPPYTYTWYVGGVQKQTGSSSSFSYRSGASGNFAVKATAKDVNGATASGTVSVTISATGCNPDC